MSSVGLRNEQFQVIDNATGKVLDTETLTAIISGRPADDTALTTGDPNEVVENELLDAPAA